MAGNGNGNGKKKPVKLKSKDQLQIGLIGTYLVQKNQHSTIEELCNLALEKTGSVVQPEDMLRALDGLKKRQIVTVGFKMVDGQQRPVWSTKNLAWKAPPEYAHITDLLPMLMHTPELDAVKSWFDNQESKGGPKKTRGNDIDDYHDFVATAKLTQPIIGSQIKNPYWDYIRKQFPSEADKLEVEGVFERCPLTGDYLIPSDVLQGWFMTNCCRFSGSADARATYIAFEPIRIKPKKGVRQVLLPVNSTKTGPSAPKAYELIDAGEEITIRFTAPCKGLMAPEQYELLLLRCGVRYRRGLSPARGRKYGGFLLTSFKDLGPVKEAHDISHLFEGLPKELLQDNPYVASAIQRLSTVSLRPLKEVGPPEDDFPHVEQPTSVEQLDLDGLTPDAEA